MNGHINGQPKRSGAPGVISFVLGVAGIILVILTALVSSLFFIVDFLWQSKNYRSFIETAIYMDVDFFALAVVLLFLSVAAAVAGLVLGIVGVKGGRSKRVLAVMGLVASFVALVLLTVLFISWLLLILNGYLAAA